MFKVGDKVVSKNIISVGPYEVVDKEEILTIKEILYDYSYLKFKDKMYMYRSQYFMTTKEYRKQKLNKICSKKEIK